LKPIHNLYAMYKDTPLPLPRCICIRKSTLTDTVHPPSPPPRAPAPTYRPVQRSVSSSHSQSLTTTATHIRQQLLLIIQQLLPRLSRVLGVRALDDGVHGTALLAEAAVDALGHVDVVTRRPSAAVFALLGLDGDCLGWADLRGLVCV
jgi:hypothetical protein